MSWGYHRGGWHGPCSQGDSIARERDSQVNEQNNFRWWWVQWKSQKMYQNVVAEGYFRSSIQGRLLWHGVIWTETQMTRRSQSVKELKERCMEQPGRQPYSQSTRGWFRNRKEVSEHVILWGRVASMNFSYSGISSSLHGLNFFKSSTFAGILILW